MQQLIDSDLSRSLPRFTGFQFATFTVCRPHRQAANCLVEKLSAVSFQPSANSPIRCHCHSELVEESMPGVFSLLAKEDAGMDISFSCGRCGQQLTIDQAGAGCEVECPKCKASLSVPNAPSGIENVVYLSVECPRCDKLVRYRSDISQSRVRCPDCQSMILIHVGGQEVRQHKARLDETSHRAVVKQDIVVDTGEIRKEDALAGLKSWCSDYPILAVCVGVVLLLILVAVLHGPSEPSSTVMSPEKVREMRLEEEKRNEEWLKEQIEKDKDDEWRRKQGH